MSRFKRIKNKSTKKSSVSIDEKIDALNKELEKTNMLSEEPTMTTSNVYSTSTFVPLDPGGEFPVPDPSGVTEEGFAQPVSGNPDDPSNWPDAYTDNSWMFNPNEVYGETNRPIFKTMDQGLLAAFAAANPGNDKYPMGGAGIVFGAIAFGTGVGYAINGHYKQVLSPGLFGDGSTNMVPPGSPYGAPYFGLFTAYRVSIEEANIIMGMTGSYLDAGGYDPSKAMPVSLWRRHSNFHDGPYENWSGKKYTSEGGLRYVLQTFFLHRAGNTYHESPVPEHQTNVQTRGTEDPPIYPGPIANLFGLGARAFEWLKGKAQGVGEVVTAIGDFAIDPFGSVANFVKNDLVDFYDTFSDTTISNDVLEPTFEKFGQILGSKTGFVLGIVTTAANDIRSVLGGKQNQFGDKPAFSSSNNPISYAANLAMSLAQSIGNGRPVVIDNSVVSSETVAQNMSVDDIIMMHETNQTLQNGMPYIGTSVDDILNPNKDGEVKKPYMGEYGFGYEGGSIMIPFIDNKGNLRIMNIGDKTLRLGGESGEGFDINTQTFTDIPSGGKALPIAQELVESGRFANELANILNQQGNNYSEQDAQDVTEIVVNNPTYQNLMTVLDNDTIGGSFVSGSSTGAINGAAGGALLYNQIKVNLGLMEPTDLQKAGGHGHVRRETIIDVNDLKPEVKAKFNELYGIKESFNESVRLGHFEPEQLNVDIEDLRKGIMPEYPKNPPAEMIDGYHQKSPLRPKPLEKEPYVKITKLDLIRNHRLKGKEADEMMNTINMINDHIKKHPEDLIHAQMRYPVDDPRLAELNWKMDQMLEAGEEYLDSNFKENKKLFNRAMDRTKNNIKLTDPKYVQRHYDELRGTMKSKPTINRKSPSRFFKKPVKKKSSMEEINDKIKKLDKDLLI